MPVVGIFEASVHRALAVLQPMKRFAILTTGKAYEEQLHKGVMKLLDTKRVSLSRFAGVVSTGIGFCDVEKGLEENVKAKISDAVKKLLGMRDIGVICPGGVILCGMEKWLRETCETELGQEAGQNVKIVDQLEAGVIAAEEAIREAACR